MKRLDRGPVDGDVIWMAIAADGVKGQHDLRAQRADVVRHLRSDALKRLRRQGVGVMVIGRAGHSRIAVAQEMHTREAELPGGAGQFGFPQLRHGVIPLEQLSGRFAHLAPRGADEMHGHAAPGIEGQCAAHAERLVIRVGQDGEDYLILHCHSMSLFLLRKSAIWRYGV